MKTIIPYKGALLNPRNDAISHYRMRTEDNRHLSDRMNIYLIELLCAQLAAQEGSQKL